MPFKFLKQRIPDVILVEAIGFEDRRGYFFEIYKFEDFTANGITDVFVQDNHSSSIKNVIRGLHYQKEPKSQAKLVMALRGEIYDVVVDIRKDSASFGQWVGATLSQENRLLLYAPSGFAHGFCVLSNEAEVFYKASDAYAAELESGIIWNDPILNIDWPVRNPLLSKRDALLPRFDTLVK